MFDDCNYFMTNVPKFGIGIKLYKKYSLFMYNDD